MIRNFRKPLVVASPKTLLRLPAATSSLNDMLPGTTFRPVLPDTKVASDADIKRVVFCTGKHYYSLDAERTSKGISDTALVRVEVKCYSPSNVTKCHSPL